MMRRPGAATSGVCGELAELWVQGLSSPHDASCGCGGMAMPTFDPAGIERDLLDYLLGKYRVGSPEGLAEFITDRRDHPGSIRFENWLAALGDASLPEDARTRLVADLKFFLDSFAEQARPRIGVCY
jgi:hypothetical protein